MSTEQEMLLRRLSGAQFAAWETHMFLDTHPNDGLALEANKKYQAKFLEVSKEYESKYGPLNHGDTYGDTRFEWVNDPWPWERTDD